MNRIIFIFSATLLSFVVQAQSIELKRFKKCYQLFTSTPIHKDHDLVKKIKSNELNGTQACMQLLSSANLLSDNRIKKNSAGEYPRESQRILRNLHFVHRGFFKIENYHKTIDGFPNIKNEENIFDDNQDAYYWTHALFKENAKVSSVITSPFSYYGLRYAKDPVEAKKRLLGGLPTENHDIKAWPSNVPVVEQGLLVGLERDTRSFTFTSDAYWSRHLSGSETFRHFGAGVIGSAVYIFKNFGKYGKRNTPDGGLHLYRRWSQNVTKDLLCRDLPSLRSADVEAEVSQTSKLLFRNSTSCMRCHAGMDPMAGNVRNIVTGGVNTAFRPFLPGTYQNANPVSPSFSGILPENSDENFHLTPAIGRLKYRSYSGQLIEQNTSSLTDLGSKIAQTDDFYVCAAKKYYRYLTGIEVSLADLGAAGASPLSELETKHRNRVVELGLALKGNTPYKGRNLASNEKQSLQWLLKTIIETKTFVTPEVFE